MNSRYYDKDKLKSSLEPEQIFDLLELWGGNPTWESNYIISDTICHNFPGEGSHKLYYYFGTKLFHCYTGCSNSSFDIFELCIKVMNEQYNLKWELYDAMDYIAKYFRINGEEQSGEIERKLEDWIIFKKHKIQYSKINRALVLKEYDPLILTRFSYPRILFWEKEGISSEVCKKNFIGYYPTGEQITIPHFDINNRLVGIRGRALAEDDALRYGKYRPLLIGKKLYNHPLSINLYNINNSKENIKKSRVVIVFESEKSCLMYQTYYGHDNDISVACCGSNLSSYQISLLKSLGVNEIIIAFDRDFENIGDEAFIRLKSKLIHLYSKYNNTIRISAIFDKDLLLPIKSSPIDMGPCTFEKLLNNRIIPKG